MRIFGKPKNWYGWARAFGWAVLAGVLIWTLAAAALRAAGDVPWMAWSGYPSFSLLNGVEMALIPLLAAILAAWLEDHEHHHHIQLRHHRETEQARTIHREAVVQRFQDTVRELLPEQAQDRSTISTEVQTKITNMARNTLHELDGQGRGDLLRFLYEHHLLSGEKPIIDLQGADLRGVILTAAPLPGIYLENVDLSNAKMNCAQLGNARLSGANLGRAFLREVDLSGAVLSGSNLSEARLDGANLQGATCSPEILSRAILIDTTDPDGRKVTNERGKQYLRDKELSMVVDRL